jgi:hypothetical protein
VQAHGIEEDVDLAAQVTGRLDRRLPAAVVIAVGCVAGAAVLGFRGQSEAGDCSSSSTSMPLGARTFTTR